MLIVKGNKAHQMNHKGEAERTIKLPQVQQLPKQAVVIKGWKYVDPVIPGRIVRLEFLSGQPELYKCLLGDISENQYVVMKDGKPILVSGHKIIRIDVYDPTDSVLDQRIIK